MNQMVSRLGIETKGAYKAARIRPGHKQGRALNNDGTDAPKAEYIKVTFAAPVEVPTATWGPIQEVILIIYLDHHVVDV